MSYGNRQEMFQLIDTQLNGALKAIAPCVTGVGNQHRAACHLIGIAAYIRDMAGEIIADIDKEKI